jgi:hypothetical protein
LIHKSSSFLYPSSVVGSYTIDITLKYKDTVNKKIEPVTDLTELGAVEVSDGVSPSSADGVMVGVSLSAVGGVVIMDPSPGISSE